jgi:ABC-2 type transport system ATP-binding protein
MTASPAIVIEGLTKKFGNFTAVDDVDLQVERGEIFGFLGPNGAGKTTTMRTLLDLIRPTAGCASIVGFDTHTHAVQIRRHIGYLPGDLALYPHLTGRETLQYFANLRGGVDWDYVTRLATRFDADLSKKVGEYSTGNRQKVGLIQALMNRPEVLILDEPSTGLDPLVQQEFQAVMHEVTQQDGATVFLSSHTLSEVERIAGRVGFIREGTLVSVESMDTMRDKALRRVSVQFADDVPPGAFDGVAGVRDVEVSGAHVSVSYEGAMGELLRAINTYEVLTLTSSNVDLDDIFLSFYKSADSQAASS